MRRRILLAAALSLALAGCSTVVDGSGGRASPTGPVPCGSDSSGGSSASVAPGCTPGPTPSPTASASTSGTAGRWTPYARSIFTTKLGDPALLNVCAVARGATLPSGLTLSLPESTLAGSCSLDIESSARSTDEPSIVISVLRDDTTATVPGAKRTSVLGQTVVADPYDADHGTCGRTLLLTQPDVTTSVRTTIYGRVPGGETATCGVGDAIIKGFAAIASGSVSVPVLPTAQPSLLSLDACRVSSAAGFATLPLLAGGDTPRPADFDTSCAWSKSGSTPSTLYVSAGTLRSSDDSPDGKPLTVDGHRLYDTATVASVCQYTSEQAEGETVEVYYSPGGGDPSAGTCRQVAGALGRYLDVLGLS